MEKLPFGILYSISETEITIKIERYLISIRTSVPHLGILYKLFSGQKVFISEIRTDSLSVVILTLLESAYKEIRNDYRRENS